jgi:hypothetical protein
MQVTKQYYVKIWSLMDAERSKRETDRVCRLKLSKKWSTLDISDSDTESDLSEETDVIDDNNADHLQLRERDSAPSSNLQGESPTKKRRRLEVEATSTPIVSPKKLLGRRNIVRRGGTWCEADERILVAGYNATAGRGDKCDPCSSSLLCACVTLSVTYL